MDPAAEGTLYPETPITVDPARVAAFRGVFGQTEGVPPTYLTTIEFVVFPQVLGDPVLALDFGRVLHGSQEYTYQRPLREGESLVAQARIESVRIRAGTGFLTFVTEVREPGGALVATARSTMIERGPDA
jgi:acyl dehydratase